MPTTYFTKHKTGREATAKTAKKLMMASPCNPITITLWEKVEEEEFYPAYVPAPMSGKREVRCPPVPGTKAPRGSQGRKVVFLKVV